VGAEAPVQFALGVSLIHDVQGVNSNAIWILRPVCLRWLDPGMLLTGDDPYVAETRVEAVPAGRIIGDDAGCTFRWIRSIGGQSGAWCFNDAREITWKMKFHRISSLVEKVLCLVGNIQYLFGLYI
jgi:hypothetical protein